MVRHGRRRTPEVTALIEAFTTIQHGMVSAGQLGGAGISGSCIHQRIKARRLFPVCPKVYSCQEGPLSREAFYMAGVLAGGDHALLGGSSAADLYEIATWNGIVEVRRPRSSERRDIRLRPPIGRSHPLQIRRFRDEARRQPVMVGFIPVVSPPQLLLDLAETWSGSKLKWSFIEADRLGLLKPPDIALLLGPNRGFKGAAEVRRLARTRVPRLEKTRSLLEALFLGLCADFGIPLPEVNQPVGEYISDFVWAELKLIVEVDGGGHRGHAKRIDDHRRENELVRDGWSVLRYDWWNLTEQPDRVAAEVIRARRIRT